MSSLVTLDSNVWEVSAPLKAPGLRIDHRMTLLRLSNGELIVHSPIQYSRELADSISELGSLRWFVAPSRFHDLYWLEWFRAFPKARFVAVPGMAHEHSHLPFTDVLDDRSPFWGAEILPFPIRGMPAINEYALFHPASRSLLVADLIFNIDADAQTVAGRLFLRLNGIYRKAGISRIFRRFIKDRKAFVESMHPILAQSFQRTIIGHGPNLGGTEALRSALSEARLLDARS